MAERAGSTVLERDGAHGGAVSRRVIKRRRGLPRGRALVGAFLVASAVVGVFGTYLSVIAAPDSAYVVAVEVLHAGDVVATEDVTLVPIDLPDAVRARSLTTVEELVGATVLHTLRPGELVQVSDVVRSGGEPGTREISFAVDASRALGERVLPGERIDILSTYGTGEAAFTVVVVSDALVLRAGSASAVLGGEGAREFTVALDDPQDPLAIAHAVDVGQLAVVRATNAATAPSGRVYRPLAPAREDNAGEGTR
jgi:Flp pilus assembly protein CpaB